jgi:hypothetical protein
MKKSISITFAVLGVIFLASMIMNHSTAQSSSKGGVVGKPIPAGVMKIAEKSCMKCHAEPGNFMAVSHLNLTNWDKYSPEKQASKANAMCKMVSKGKMPPKKFRESHPGDVPSDADDKMICNWAESIQADKKSTNL